MQSFKVYTVLAAAVGLLLGTASVQAQLTVSNDALDLPLRLVEPEHPDRPYLDTALVFTNLDGRPSRVLVIGYDRGGTPVGRTEVRVPANGVNYAMASELTDANIFFGKVEAIGSGRLEATAVLIGARLTDLPVKVHRRSVSICTDASTDADLATTERVRTKIIVPVAAAVH